MNTAIQRSPILVTVFVILHHVVAYLHGEAHTDIPVILSSWQNLFISVITVIVPLMAIVMVWIRQIPLGVMLLALAMAGSLLFGVYHHNIFVALRHRVC